MDALSRVLAFKIGVTVIGWCAPLLLLPGSVLEWLGLPAQPTWMFVRMLAWAYLALCVGYAFALAEALKGRRLTGAIWAGIVSNGGACVLLIVHGSSGTWSTWGAFVQVLLWASAAATAAITAGLYLFGVRQRPRARGSDQQAAASAACLQ